MVTSSPISPDTEVVLLLCGRFGGEGSEAFSPLSPREYSLLAAALASRSLRPAALLEESGRDLVNDAASLKFDPNRLKFLLERGATMALALERWRRSGLWVASRGDVSYPRRWRKLLRQQAPPLLFGAGDQTLLERGGIALVGSRNATESGLGFARALGEACAREGLTVISGGARGVDSAGMQGATEEGGRAVGILSGDLLRASVHRQNRAGLQNGNLVLVSPFHPEAGFNAGNAMARNKCIYALSDHAVVVDSDLGKGGTWEGAVENLRNSWVPLHVRIPGDSTGNIALVEQGGVAFTQDPSVIEGLRKILDDVARSRPEKLVEAREISLFDPPSEADADRSVENPPTTSTLETPANVVVSPDAVPKTITTESNTLGTSNAVDVCKRDLYEEFFLRLESILAIDSRTEDEIASILDLEKVQAKTWLKRALDQVRIERSKRPVRYSLVRQVRLLGG